MTLLILGSVIFFGIHLVPSTPLKARMLASLGTPKYKAFFSGLSLLGLGLIIYGFSLAPMVPLWNPLPWGRTAAIVTMPLATILMCASNMPNNIRRMVKHPMLISLILWGSTHLAANGDLASTVLFSSFTLFALVDIMLVTVAGRYNARAPVSFLWDMAVVLMGLVLYRVLFHFHGSFTGIPL